MSDRGRQIIRQWRILQILERTKGALSVTEIHEALDEECNRRTVYRDLEQLVEAGFPVHEVKGRWRSLQESEGGWSVPVTPTELLLIALSEDLFASLRGTWLADPLHDLRQKLLALMTPRGREFFDRLRSQSIATLSAPGDFSNQTELMRTLFRAINEQRVVHIVYNNPNAEPTSRDIEPYTVWFHEGSVRVLAHCRRAGAIRQFVVQRIASIEPRGEHFMPRDDFDAAAYIRESFGAYHGTVRDVVIDFSPRVAHLITERRYHHSQVISQSPSGWTRLSMRLGGLPEIARWVAGFGGDARPVTPPELVAKVRALFEGGLLCLDGA